MTPVAVILWDIGSRGRGIAKDVWLDRWEGDAKQHLKI